MGKNKQTEPPARHLTLYERWEAEMDYPAIVVHEPQCFRCIHWLADPTFQRCMAYPDGIPAAIWLGQHDHTEPYHGDRGVTFSPATAERITQRLAQYRQDAADAAGDS